MDPIEWCKQRIAEEKAEGNWTAVMHYEEMLELWTKRVEQ